jgi:hypothetical protein
VAERELMRGKMNSYGKTWHVWSTPMAGQPGDKLPLGPALLAWSVNRNGELRNEFIEQRDQRMCVSTAEIGRRRQDLRALAKP